MALVSMTITVRRNDVGSLVAGLPQRMAGAVDASAGAIRDLASQLAPRDTGALGQSIYVSTPNGSDYSQRSSAAQTLNHDAALVEEVNPEFILSLSGANDPTYLDVVGVSVDYGIYQEFGTRFMSAQSFMTPAAENERPRFIARMQGLLE